MNNKISPWLVVACISLLGIVAWRFFGINADEIIWEIKLPGALEQSILPNVYAWIILTISIYAAVWFAMWWKFGREYIDIPVYETAATALPPVKRSPALVAYLVNQGEVGGSAYAATVLYLAQKQMIRIEDGNTPAIYFQPEKSTEEVSFVDRLVFSNLLHLTFGNDSVTYDDLKTAMTERPQEMKNFYRSWKKAIARQAEEQGFFEKAGTEVRNLFYGSSFVFAIPLIGLLEAARIVGENAYVSLDIFVIIYANLIYWIGRAFMRWDRKHADEVSRWIAFKRYISGVSRMRREGPESMPVWEDVLIYATALGCARKVGEALPLIVKPDKENPSFDGLILGRMA